MRHYNKRIFAYYQSYTLGGKGKELGPTDVKPIWRDFKRLMKSHTANTWMLANLFKLSRSLI